MTLTEPSTTRRKRRRRRSNTTTAATTSGATRAVRLVLTGLWLVGVPLFMAAWANQRFGTAWGSIPAFWLDGDQAGPSVIGLLTLLGAFAWAVVLHRWRAIFLLAVLPALLAWIGYVGFGRPAWVGALTGLSAGWVVLAVRRWLAR